MQPKNHKSGAPLLLIFLLTIFFNLLPFTSGNYLWADHIETIVHKSEFPHFPAAPFQVEEDDPVYPSIIWDKTFGGSSYENYSSVVPTSDGGYLLGGLSNSDASGDKSENSKGGFDYWVVKTDAEGNKVWDKTFGGSSSDQLSTVIITPDGGYLLAGISQSDISGDKSENSIGDYDYWIIKIDAEGNKIWDKTFGGNYNDFLESVVLTPEGGYVLAGYSYSGVSGDKSGFNYGFSDYWIIKIDADGNKIWDKTFGSKNEDVVSNVISSPDEGYLLTGTLSMDKFSEDVEGGKGKSDFWIVKIDADGNKVWDKYLGGEEGDGLSSAILTNDGGYLLAGISESDISGDKSENNKGGLDYWVVKIDADGNKIWDKTIGGNGNDSFPSVIAVEEGRYLLAGTSGSQASGDKSENRKGINDYWIVKIDADGDKIWDKTIGGIMNDSNPTVIAVADGSYLLAGESESDSSGDKSEDSKGETDYWVVKIKELVSPAITGLSLIDAQRDLEIKEIKAGNLVPQENGLQSIRANIFADVTDSVTFDLKGPINHWQADDTAPYSLFGDTEGDYAGRQFMIGKYTLTVTLYAQAETVVNTISFEIIKNDNINPAVIEWDKTLGGNDTESLNSCISTPDGGYLLAGSSYSKASGDKTENNFGSKRNYDYWIVKIDADGNKTWDKTFGSNKNDVASSIISSPDGGYLLAGSSSSGAIGDKSETNKGGLDYWIIKIDADGNKVWDKTFGGNKKDEVMRILSTTDGGYLLAGNSISDASGNKSEDNKSIEDDATDYWIVKIDADGNKQWDKTFGGDESDELHDAILTPDNGYLLAGSSTSVASGDKSENNKGGLDYWVVKIDADGNKIWDKTLGGNKHDLLSDIISTPDGSYLLAGSSDSNSTEDKSEDNKGSLNSYDYWIVKIDANGNKEWDKTLGGKSDDRSTAIFNVGGDYVVAGSSGSNASSDKSEDNKGQTNTDDYWIVKIDANGNKIWDQTLGGYSSDYLSDALLTPDGSYLLAGSSISSASEDKSENSNRYDYWVVKLKDYNDSPVSTTLTLIDAPTDQDIKVLYEGDEIYQSSRPLSIRANIQGSVDYVTMQLQGPVNYYRSESEAPYALFGNNAGDYAGKVLQAGAYTITVTPFSEGKEGEALTVSFYISNATFINSFTLIDAASDQEVGMLSEGDVIDLASLSNRLLNIRANTEAENLEKVIFSLHGPSGHARTEFVAPYTLFGDAQKPNGSVNYTGRQLSPGTYTLNAIPYLKDGQTNPSAITFTVIDSNPLQTEVYPVPTTGMLNILHDGSEEGAQMQLMDFDGHELLSQPAMKQMDMSNFKKGIYYLKIISREGVQIFRVLKE